MYKILDENIKELKTLKKYPQVYYKGNSTLLKRLKVSIVGSRNPTPYTRECTYNLARALSARGVCVVSGGAMGVDAVAHDGAGVENTICVLGSGIDVYYPAINKNLIASIANHGLLLSQFEPDFKATQWSFIQRNEIVVALGNILIVTQADIDSGSMRSVEFALSMGKKIYVLPHTINESRGTNTLLAKGEAMIIHDINEFVSQFGKEFKDERFKDDDFFIFCQQNPTLDDAVFRFKDRVYEAELLGQISITNGKINLI
ncbi:MAG: DNA-protecting protein DprA [Sulfurovaceae bacterium]|nr:DNA-protecting protein DprA [Sulfurovaceae bacterium]MDD5548561.1 DNA-protecting protein DprA [Sulfurovaceae bacterium]